MGVIAYTFIYYSAGMDKTGQFIYNKVYIRATESSTKANNTFTPPER